jgi:hypothetical protein
MHIYLKHPVHGTKVAIAELEAKYDERNGWVRYNPEVISVNALEIKRKYTRRAAAKGA